MLAPLSKFGSVFTKDVIKRWGKREGEDGRNVTGNTQRLIAIVIVIMRFHRIDMAILLGMYEPASIEMTLRMTFSTLCTGLQRSEACSYISGSSPGVWRIDMQTLPSG